MKKIRNKDLEIARKHCANLTPEGKCLGIEIITQSKKGYLTPVLNVQTKNSGKACADIIEDCNYFKHVINKGMS